MCFFNVLILKLLRCKYVESTFIMAKRQLTLFSILKATSPSKDNEMIGESFISQKDRESSSSTSRSKTSGEGRFSMYTHSKGRKSGMSKGQQKIGNLLPCHWLSTG